MSESTAAHLVLGRRGECLAARFLESRGLVVLSRNWRCPEGELDLVLSDGRILVVCEVKTRRSAAFGDPAEAVGRDKARRVRRLARLWMSSHRVGWCQTRFDIVSVLWPSQGTPRIDHLPGVF